MSEHPVTVSEAAARRIAEIVSADGSKQALRVSVEGGGCSGFSYKFDLADAPQEDDLVIATGEAKVLIDSMSLIYMEGSEIDFVDNLLGQSFQIKNPNAVASCGCGTSFSI
ncbi:iron-sulfur cluster insertion protein ErpA [Rhizobium sp. SSA_523]|uniref:iron-sulfur cluster insertion protein ErpA n=1 Tax=Rhizobium sp. SSA_523 TaxID=2952477 RepID=UPI00209028AC|nr:iron-sulfur cluster insertion protein ErpA [Rhizobium sp. SSA_523]MCO5734041.1 iron-sulfur cluster insertion protein ErpA [Rhizobium sp. SSA_523]WKC24680.1 iron-sulfur cluster insertion protein ErpA [Rhizobium sp. SSA_523]